jgi:flagellar biosynthesis/type III secretory pathway protein FliH
MKRYLSASAVVVLALLTLPACAHAQGGYHGPRDSIYEHAYREGLREGERDARRGEPYSYRDERAFRQADRGYNRRFGDRDRYRQVFRSGYAEGYSAGYRRHAGYGRNDGRYGGGIWGNRRNDPRYGGPYSRDGYGYGYSGAAFENGARDGYEKGIEDARRNRSFDPLRHSWYRSGDRHYERRYGSRDGYKDVYRRGFQQGYERGYRESRYRY